VGGTARSVLRYLRRCRLQIVGKRSANSEESYFLAICVATARLRNSNCKLSFTGSREIRGRRRWTAHGPFSVAVRTWAWTRRDALAVFIQPSRRRHRRSGSQILQAEFADKRLRQYHVPGFRGEAVPL